MGDSITSDQSRIMHQLQRRRQHHTRRFAMSNLFSIGVTCIGHYLETINLKSLLCSLSHGPKQRISLSA